MLYERSVSGCSCAVSWISWRSVFSSVPFVCVQGGMDWVEPFGLHVYLLAGSGCATVTALVRACDHGHFIWVQARFRTLSACICETRVSSHTVCSKSSSVEQTG